MIRKVNSVGTGTLTLSLPADWVKKNKVQKGDLVYVTEDKNGALKLEIKEPKEDHLKKELNSEGLTPYLRKLVAGFYKAGYDEVEVRYSGTEEVDRIQTLLEYTCIGYEIMSIGKKTITIKSVSKIVSEEFDEMYRKIFNIISGVGHELTDAFSSKDFEKIKSTIIRHKLVNRYADFCRRSINKFPSRFAKAGPQYSVLETLEKISDHYRAFAEEIVELKQLPSKDLIDMLRKTNNFFDAVKILHYQYDHLAMQKFIQTRKALNKELVPGNLTLKKEELMLFFYLKTIIQLSYDLNGPITTMNV
jgi:phosphate uptake regulator